MPRKLHSFQIVTLLALLLGLSKGNAQKLDSAYFDSLYLVQKGMKNRVSDSIFEITELFHHQLSKVKGFEGYARKCDMAVANYFYRKQDFGEALERYEALKKRAELANDTQTVMGCIYNQANVYQFLGMHEEAVDLLNICLEHQITTKNYKNYPRTTRNLAESYFNAGHYHKALSMADSGIYYHKQQPRDSMWVALAYNYKANALWQLFLKDQRDTSLLSQALQACNDGLSYRPGMMGQVVSRLLFVKALIADYTGDPKEAIRQANQTLRVWQGYPVTLKSLLAEPSELLAKCYADVGQQDSALYFLTLYSAYKDSLKHLDSDRLAHQLKVELEFQNNKAEASLALKSEQEQRDAQHEAYLARQKRYYIIAGVAVLIVLILFMVIRKRSRSLRNLYDHLAGRNKELNDSIHYAQRIQHSILPSEEELSGSLPESFVMYLPKDVVAGDFYWLKQVDNKVYFAVGDCTGHGVPGALVSLICHDALEQTLDELGIRDVGKILDSVRDIIIGKLNSSVEEEVKDGMDVAICCLDTTNRTIAFAGAHNPLWIVRNGEVVAIKADRQPVGLYEHAQPFTTHQTQLENGDHLYLFSDGYADQFGGTNGKKFKSSNFKKLVVQLSNNSVDMQQKALETRFREWKEGYEQLDDVCVMGVKI